MLRLGLRFALSLAEVLKSSSNSAPDSAAGSLGLELGLSRVRVRARIGVRVRYILIRVRIRVQIRVKVAVCVRARSLAGNPSHQGSHARCHEFDPIPACFEV